MLELQEKKLVGEHALTHRGFGHSPRCRELVEVARERRAAVEKVRTTGPIDRDLLQGVVDPQQLGLIIRRLRATGCAASDEQPRTSTTKRIEDRRNTDIGN